MIVAPMENDSSPIDGLLFTVEQRLHLDHDVRCAGGVRHLERHVIRGQYDVGIGDDRPGRVADDAIVDDRAERASGGLQHGLRRALVEEAVDLLLHLRDQGCGGLNIDLHVGHPGLQHGHTLRLRGQLHARAGEFIGRRGQHQIVRAVVERGSGIGRSMGTRVEGQIVHREGGVVEDGDRDRGDRTGGESPAREDSRPGAVAFHVKRDRLGGAVHAHVRHDRVPAIALIGVAHDGASRRAAQHGVAEQRRCRVGGEPGRGEVLLRDRHPGHGEGGDGIAVLEGGEVLLDEPGGAVHRASQGADRGEERGDQQHGDAHPEQDRQRRAGPRGSERMAGPGAAPGQRPSPRAGHRPAARCPLQRRARRDVRCRVLDPRRWAQGR